MHVFRQIHALAAAAAQRSLDLARARSVVIGMPGVVDPQTGRVSLIPNISGLADLSVPAALGELFAATVTVENDVNLAMLGEAWQGCARGAGDAAFLALGAGVGLGMIVNGRLARGATGAAGEIGYLPLGLDLESDAARAIGAFELQVGGAGVLRRYREAGGDELGAVRELFDRLEAGERAAADVIDATARAVALALTCVAAVLDPELIVLGGGVGVRPELVERVRAAMPRFYARPVEVRASALGARAGLVGAVSLAVRRVQNSLFGVSSLASAANPRDPLARDAA